MKKVLLIIGLIVLAGAVVAHCGGGGAKDPTAAKATFSDPDGQITSDNATTVMNDTLASGGASSGEAVMGLPFTGTSKLAFETAVRRYKPNFHIKASSIESCVSGDENSGTIDVGCIVDAGYLEGCTGSGTLTYSINNDTHTNTIGFSNFGLTCPSDDIDIASCNGTWSVLMSGETVDVLCADGFSCTINGETDNFTGCLHDGDYLVSGEGGDVVCTEITINSGCTRVCGDFNTSEGTVSVTCTVSDPSSCTSWTEINEITSCTLASTACSL